MSEIPGGNATIISEIYGYKWDDDYDSKTTTDAINQYMLERPELFEFCEEMRHDYWRQAEKRGYRPSWRDFRNFTVHDRFEYQFDMDEVMDEIEKRIEENDE